MEHRVHTRELLTRFAPEPLSADALKQLTHPWRPAQWRRHWLGARLPEFVQQAPDTDTRLSRWTVAVLGESVKDADSALEFYFAVAAWSSGLNVRSVFRACRPTAQPGFGEKLYAALVHTRELEAVEAYAAWRHSCAIPYVGPALFSKLMYFSARNSLYRSDPLPLLIDGRTTRALGWSATAGWAAATYQQYLGELSSLAGLWHPQATAEAVEAELTRLGWELMSGKSHAGVSRCHEVGRKAELLSA